MKICWKEAVFIVNQFLFFCCLFACIFSYLSNFSVKSMAGNIGTIFKNFGVLHVFLFSSV